MAIPLYLAMTAAEFSSCKALPPAPGWMACHFSAYGLGLSNLPPALPDNAMVILNDRTPICGHDPQTVLRQLREIPCSRYLLDFQRPDCPQTAQLVRLLAKELPHPVGVSQIYAERLDCPIFLPPAPPSVPAEEYLRPWQGREIWLETAADSEIITVTSAGSIYTHGCATQALPLPHFDEALLCHYTAEIREDEIRFILQRTRDDAMLLWEQVQTFGVSCAVGLYQELK